MPIEEDPEIRCRFTLRSWVNRDRWATVCRHLDSLGDRITIARALRQQAKARAFTDKRQEISDY